MGIKKKRMKKRLAAAVMAAVILVTGAVPAEVSAAQQARAVSQNEMQQRTNVRTTRGQQQIGVMRGTWIPVEKQRANEKKIYEFLKKKMKMNTAAACGVLANIQCESSFNPTAHWVGEQKGQENYGICQWGGPRLKELKKYCKKKGYSYKKLDGQLAFLKYELQHEERSAFLKTKDVPNSAKGSYQAAENWARYFERCASVYYEQRGELAKKTYWKKYKKAEEKASYTIHFDGNGATSGSMKDMTCVMGESCPLSGNQFKRKGYKFAGWNKKADGSGKKYSGKAQVKDLTKKEGAKVTLYAQWKKK